MKKAIIIGAGPAGLTAAFELLKRTDIQPTVLEKSGDIGGISKTVNYKGNRIDIGGHRFFSKSDRVMNWWLDIMPLEESAKKEFTINYRNRSTQILPNEQNVANKDANKIMLVRSRLSRIYFLRQFFNYPLKLSLETLRKLGYSRSLKILASYIKIRLRPIKPEKNLEDFFINKFGDTLYRTFFKDYTEKVWGIACNEISADWGAQRIKGVSISKAISHAVKQSLGKKENDIHQKDAETSLIEKFLYPKYGPGQLWEEVAAQVNSGGGQVLMHKNVSKINVSNNKIVSVEITDAVTGEAQLLEGDYFFSSMPVKELVAKLNTSIPNDVKEVAEGLMYRDFITVGVLLSKFSLNKSAATTSNTELKDNWIYIQESDVKVGRLQIFNNWSPFMVNNKDHIWVGMEYFCKEGDELWTMPDEALKKLGMSELEKIGLIKQTDVLDTTIVRMEKAYPAYFGTYDRFDTVKDYLNQFDNLFLIGRNGMHKYNNSDHSMLTAMTAVDNICNDQVSKENIWEVNTEQEYHETKEK
ncbi:NAD(P)/FAD-dependent oxidoreductase [Ferruginibacter albus]|uniref:NAD(P)/FAD-dependent oxidoreductase n=1 Tax=Ferruginibacter albus TaxID=2875540 RepID=UPI001CC80A4D|nr:NAD(P)/FAD-dependent oxidoreductase [Ferruginibacter albus]UAY52596.1 NAD(P)/FAD-dependent oxidoreductase [Ferruginibacter albus]